MSDNELLIAISDMMDTKLQPVNDRLDKIERTQEDDILPRLGKLEQSVGKLEQSVGKLEHSVGKLEQSVERLEESQKKTDEAVGKLEHSVGKLEKSVRKIELTMENNVLPRLQTIESCYMSTYERYQNGVDKIETMQTDIDIIKTTVMKHSEKLQKLA